MRSAAGPLLRKIISYATGVQAVAGKRRRIRLESNFGGIALCARRRISESRFL